MGTQTAIKKGKNNRTTSAITTTTNDNTNLKADKLNYWGNNNIF